MKRNERPRYEAPCVKELSVMPERLICISGNSGTEKVGKSGSSYNDSVFI
ncbi:MAG: hypothetical protein IJV01_02000 [Bacteroidales bacterium]|nr:hypothetical protein [Bacteroidales bacterium]